jgi:hypothetical protein
MSDDEFILDPSVDPLLVLRELETNMEDSLYDRFKGYEIVTMADLDVILDGG